MNGTERAAQWALIILAVLAVFAVLNIAESIFIPMVLALVVGVILSPVGAFLDKMGLPKAASSLFSFSIAIVLIIGLILAAQPIITRAMETAPRVHSELNRVMISVQAELRGLEDMKENIESAINPTDSGDGESAEEPADAAAEAIPSVRDVVFMAPAVLAQIVIFLGILFFFILTREEIYRFIASRVASKQDRSDVAMRLAAAERQVSQYFITISLINAALGVLVAIAMFIIGMPSPLIWGALAFLMNYLLYIGPAALLAALLVAGIVVFDNFYALLPALCYLCLNFTEAQFVTPSFLGKKLSINPLLIFISLSVFYWLWGPIGAIVAIPLLVWGAVLTADIRSIREEMRGDNSKSMVNMEPATDGAS